MTFTATTQVNVTDIPVEYDVPPINPQGLGLYAAGSVIPTGKPSRIIHGVRLRPFNCSTSAGTWPTDPCANPFAAQQVAITGSPTGGTFTLTTRGLTTAAIARNATAEAVASALNALEGVDVTVTGGPGPGTPWVITFLEPQGPRPLMVADGSGLTGGTAPAVDVTSTHTGILKTGNRNAALDPFAAVQPWAFDQCDPQETDAQVIARATQTLRLQEPLFVESAFASRLLDDDGTPGTADSLLDAISQLDVALGLAGYTGVIHASRKFAAFAANNSLIIGSAASSVLRTPLGHVWAFGGGYDDVLGDTIVATGPISIWQDDLFTQAALDPNTNTRIAVAERTVVVGYECFISSVTVDSTP